MDTKLATFFPQIKNADKITIADMMHHRSGIHDASDDTTYRSDFFKTNSEADVLNILSKCPSDFEPDTKSAYSNSNYILLGWIIEKIDNENYATSLKKRIVDKLHLKNTFVGGKINVYNNESLPYIYGNNWTQDKQAIKVSQANIGAIGGAGVIVSTPIDLNIFLNGLFDGKLIDKQSLLQDTTIKGSFGMDIYKMPFNDKYGWGHGGDILDYHSDLFTFLHDSLTVAVCYNGINYSPNSILTSIFSCCFNVPFDLSSFNEQPIVNVDSTILAKYIGTYSSQKTPLKFKVFIDKGRLYGQVIGQMQFPLSAISENEFIFKLAGLDIIFDAEKATALLKQSSKEILFNKE